MSIEMRTQLGMVDVSRDVVATIAAGGAAVDCYGYSWNGITKANKRWFV